MADIIAIKNARLLAGITPEKFGRKPVDKTPQQAELHIITPEEQVALENAAILQAFTDSGEFILEQVIEKRLLWFLPEKALEAYGRILGEAYRIFKAGIREKEVWKQNARLQRRLAPEKPTNAEPVYTQEEGDRGLWWYAIRKPPGPFTVVSYEGDLQPIIDARERSEQEVVGPFRALNEEAAKEHVQPTANAKRKR